MNTQPEALRLADVLDRYAHGDDFQRPVEAAIRELRRQHEEIKCEERRFSDLWEQFAALDKKNQELQRGFDSVLNQAFKDQKDAERYMHLKWVIAEEPIYFLKLLDKADDQIDQLMDERIRSYDE